MSSHTLRIRRDTLTPVHVECIMTSIRLIEYEINQIPAQYIYFLKMNTDLIRTLYLILRM